MLKRKKSLSLKGQRVTEVSISKKKKKKMKKRCYNSLGGAVFLPLGLNIISQVSPHFVKKSQCYCLGWQQTEAEEEIAREKFHRAKGFPRL